MSAPTPRAVPRMPNPYFLPIPDVVVRSALGDGPAKRAIGRFRESEWAAIVEAAVRLYLRREAEVKEGQR